MLSLTLEEYREETLQSDQQFSFLQVPFSIGDCLVYKNDEKGGLFIRYIFKQFQHMIRVFLIDQTSIWVWIVILRDIEEKE